jgi:hypothetical protein
MKWVLLAPWKEWGACNPVSKGVVAAVIVLLLIAYLPTLQYDYLPTDQWRAFRYSMEGEPPLQRGILCSQLVWPFYLQTGRPFVWFGECVEHAMVSRITDFKYLRPIMFGVVLLTVLYLGTVFAPLLGGFPMGVAAAAAFVMAPGYSFMYLQGMLAIMVLGSVILSALSFMLYRHGNGHPEWPASKRLLVSGLLFIGACLIYPTYAFIVIALILLELGLGPAPLLMTRVRLAVQTLLFYCGASLVYYAIVHASVFLLRTYTGSLPDVGPYEVEIQKSAFVFYEKVAEAAQYFWHMPLFNFDMPPGVAVVLLATFAGAAARNTLPRSRKALFILSATAVLMGVVSALLLLAAISPWLFSKMGYLVTRHIVPWNLFFCGSTVGLIGLLCSYFPTAIKWAPIATLMVFVLPLSSVHYRLSLLEVMVTNVEIDAMRSHLSNWVQNKGWLDKNYLLVVLPLKARPSFAEHIISYSRYGNDNAMLATSHDRQDPSFVPWMFHAIFREFSERPKINLVNCGFDQLCANAALQHEGTVVLGYTDGLTEIRSPVEPFVINLSLLTSQPTTPTISRISKAPTVKASSTLGNFGPYGLFTAMQPGWHAEQRPQYPQTLNIDLAEAKTFRKLLLLPQDGLPSRMPGSLEISIKSGDGDWLQVGRSEDLCNATREEGWYNITLGRAQNAQFVRLTIFRNCGDPELLTLRGLRFE